MGHESDRDRASEQVGRLVAASITLLAHQLRIGRDAATKTDLADTERRISKLISGNRPNQVRFEWAVALVRSKPTKPKLEPMKIQITNEQMIRVKLAPVTDARKPAKLDGKPTWEVLSGDSTIEVDEDGLGANLVSSDLPGDTQILVKADADIGEGVEEISEIIELTVLGATAKNLGISVGTAAVKPEPV